MAEETEAPKKKKPIIPIIMVLVVLLGGGFFMMKSKGGKAKPAIAISDKESEIEEFLTNTQNPSIYVRAKITVRLRKDYDDAKLKANMGDLRDAVLLVFNNTPPNDVTDPQKRSQLKKTLADAMNKALEEPLDDLATRSQKKPKINGRDPSTNDWDSQTGPVLKVRFTSLATQ